MKIPLFDIDGTLVKTGSAINQNAFHHAVKQVYGVDAYHNEINPEGMVDNQILVAILKLHGFTEEQVKEKIDQEIQAVTNYAIEQEPNIQLDVLPGVVSLLRKLREENVPMGALTGNVEGLAWMKLHKAGLKEFIQFGAFGSQAHVRAELVEIARQNAQKVLGKEFNTEDFVIIGDTPKDIQCARDAGIGVAAIATGKFSFEELSDSKPDLLVHDLESEGQKVLDFILENKGIGEGATLLI